MGSGEIARFFFIFSIGVGPQCIFVLSIQLKMICTLIHVEVLNQELKRYIPTSMQTGKSKLLSWIKCKQKGT